MLKPSTQFFTRAVPYQWYVHLANFNMYMCMCECGAETCNVAPPQYTKHELRRIIVINTHTHTHAIYNIGASHVAAHILAKLFILRG